MIVLVCGGRDFTNKTAAFEVLDLIDKHTGISTVIQGEARGADTLGRQWAEERKRVIESFPADWEKHGKSAGYRRNTQMIERLISWRDLGYDIGVVVFPGGKGTQHTLDLATKHNLPIINLIR